MSASLVAPEKTLLSQALLRLLSQPELRERFSAAIQQMHFGESSWSSIATQTISVYDQVIGAAPK